MARLTALLLATTLLLPAVSARANPLHTGALFEGAEREELSQLMVLAQPWFPSEEAHIDPAKIGAEPWLLVPVAGDWPLQIDVHRPEQPVAALDLTLPPAWYPEGPPLAGGHLDGEAFHVELDEERLSLWPAEAVRRAGETEYHARPEADEIALSASSRAPYRVLADQLHLRSAPSSRAALVDSLGHGADLYVLARSAETQRIGPLSDHWLLVQSGDTIGWAYGAYVARHAFWKGEGTLSHWSGAGPTWVAGVREQPDKSIRPSCAFDGVAVTAPTGEVLAADLFLSNLDGDRQLDPICVYERPDRLTVCPALSRSRGGYRFAGCADLDDTISIGSVDARDVNHDGIRDLVIDDTILIYDRATRRFEVELGGVL